MKYGSELSSWSVPEWRAHNIDYNEIKLLIKRATQKGSRVDGDGLYQALVDEYNRINLFVKSKSGEIYRRIATCQRIVDKLAEEEPKSGEVRSTVQFDSYNSNSCQAKLFNLHEDLNRLIRDVQSLSRFIGAQRTGFRKLLKKYTKWSKSDTLRNKFQALLDSPDSFIHEDFTSCFLELSLLYDVLRNAKVTSVTRTTNAELPRESFAKFDCDMVTSGSSIFRAWVHQDNIVELKLQLLKYMTLFSADGGNLKKTRSFVGTSASSSRKNSDAGSDPDIDSTGTIFLDNKKKLLSVQTRKEPGQICWAKDKFSNVVLCSPTGGLRQFSTLKLNDQQLKTILECAYDQQVELIQDMVTNSGKLALEWCGKRQVSPLAKVVCERTRFIRPQSEDELQDQFSPMSTGSQSMMDCVWATIDTDLSFTAKGSTNISTDRESDTETFPHAVFEIRWSGPTKPEWISEVESSHLIYKVTDFSLFVHAISLFYPSQLQNMPAWLKILEENVDIRLSPTQAGPLLSKGSYRDKRDSAASTPWNGADAPTYPSILLNDQDPSFTQQDYYTFRKPHPSAPASPAGEDTQAPRTPRGPSIPSSNTVRVKYWNEFDDSEEGEGLDIFVIPEDDDGRSGVFSDSNVENLVRLSTKFIRGLCKAGVRITGKTAAESKPLLSDYEGSSLDEDETEEDEEDEEGEDDYHTQHISSPRFKPRRVHYETFPEEDIPVSPSKQRDAVLTFLYSMCFFLSELLLSILFGVILGEDMGSISVATFVFINIAQVFALLVAVLGMCFFLLRQIPGWVHQTIVLTTFFSIVCLGVGSIAYLWSLK